MSVRHTNMHPHWSGHPYHYYHHAMRRCGPHRLFWFIMGAGTATFFIKHRESRKEQYYDQCYKAQRPVLEHPSSSAVPVTPPMPTPTQGWKGEAPAAAPMTPGPWGFNSREEWDKQWEREKERAWSLSKQAGDTVSDLSEATLDSVLSTVETLKLKLKEHREERERERKAFEKELEEKRNSRLV